MHVVFDFVGHVKVDDVLDVGKVEAFGCDVGGNQDVLARLFKVVDGFDAFLLVLAA